MERMRRSKWIGILITGSLFSTFGGCLPENFLALSARNFSVALANSVLTAAVTPIFNAVGVQPPDTTDGEDDTSTAG